MRWYLSLLVEQGSITPAKAGVYMVLDSRFRGNDKIEGITPTVFSHCQPKWNVTHAVNS